VSAATRAAIAARYYDRFEEKHEGPWSWASYLPGERAEASAHDQVALFPRESADFLRVAGHDVLLPIGRDHHPHLTILHTICSDDGRYLTVFLQDRTLEVRFPQYGENPVDHFLAICLKLPGDDFFLAVVYHEWLPVDLA